MAVYFKNNNVSGAFFIDSLGFTLTIGYGELYQIDEEFDYDDDLCDNEELINLVKNSTLILFLDDRELLPSEGMEWLTKQNYLEDQENERWMYSENSVNVIESFTQLRITGRPLTLHDGATLTLEEGADLIID